MAQTSKGAISSPLASSATTLNPLTISLDLASLAAPSAAPTTAAPGDYFDQIDAARDIGVAPRRPPEAAAASGTRDELHTDLPLVDSTALLFPTTSGYTEKASGDEPRPPWIDNTSERVTALLATRLPSACPSQEELAAGLGKEEGETKTGPTKRTRLLVAAGTQAGSLWFFAGPLPPPSAREEVPMPARPPFTQDSRRTSSSSLSFPHGRSPPRSTSSPSSPPPGLFLSAASAPTSPLVAGVKHAFPLLPSSSNPPTSRKRHASVTPSSSSASHPSRPAALTHRNSSASLATRCSISQAGGAETPHSQGQPSRLRKASATVSISPSMFPDFSSSTTAASSAPMSPSLSSTSRNSYSRDWDAGSMKSPTMAAPSVTLSSPSPTRGGHTKAKDSITTGIGLWESDSVGAQSLEDLIAPSVDGEDELAETEAKEVEERLDSLIPRLKVGLEGAGAVVGMEVVQGLRLGKEEEGGVLVVLRSDGTLSLHSLIDGRSLGGCHADSGRRKEKEVEAVSGRAARASESVWEGFQVLCLGESTVALLHTPIRLSIIDLDALQAQQPVHVAVGRAMTVVTREGIHFLVYSTPTPFAPSLAEEVVETSSEPIISLRPIFTVAAPAPAPVSAPSLSAPATSHSHSVASSVQVRIDHSHSAGPLSGLSGSVFGLVSAEEDNQLIAWTETGLAVFGLREQSVAVRGTLKLAGVKSVLMSEGKLFVRTIRDCRVYNLQRSNNGETELVLNLLSTTVVDGVEACISLPPCSSSSDTDLLVVRSHLSSLPSPADEDEEASPIEQARTSLRTLEILSTGAKGELKVLYKARQPTASVVVARVTACVRLDRERVILGYSSGLIRELHFHQLDHAPSAEDQQELSQLGGAITVLQLIEFEGRQVLVAGSVDGSAGAWDPSDWSPIGRWNLFASPVSHLACLWDPDASPSVDDSSSPSPQNRILAFISANSPVALVSLSLSPATSRLTSTLLFVLPGTASPVESLSTDEGNAEILVIYQQGLARVCHIETRELRRSMDRKTARGVLKEKGKDWTTWFALGGDHGAKGAGLIDPMLTLDLRAEVDDALRSLPWAGESKRPSRKAASLPALATSGIDTPTEKGDGQGSRSPASASTKESLSLVRVLLSNLATFGLDNDTDDLLLEHLGVERPAHQLRAAATSSSTLSFNLEEAVNSAWVVSPVATAQRLLHIVCLLRVFLNFPETERYAGQVIVFYASFLQEAVGGEFAFPSLDVLADHWLDKSNEVQQAARSLFGTYLGASSDARVLALVERWQDLLPARQVEGGALFGSADQALLVAGLVATERYKLLSAAVLKDIALSISQYLDDERHPYHQSIATELCSRGFNIWQNYLDAMSLVRQLFGLATGRNPSTPNELRGLARMATLHVAGVNTPLFITTLLHDILDAPSATHRNATLKLLGFMIRKKPLVLYTSLPRIAEAVVKSLDPTVTALRETVHQAATVILNELVRTYPSIDFHHRSQRLAVGTHEGSTIIYDLKTATRLYVLEGHKRPVTALSWSPDGHRLVSVSLEESKAVVWKVGLGILSMFMPGAPPRQGGGAATEPFKTFEFHVGAEAHMTNAATLEWVVFDWPAERTARLRIRETALNFGT